MLYINFEKVKKKRFIYFRTLSLCDGLGTVGKLLDLLFVYLNQIQHHISIDVVNKLIKIL